MQRLARAVIGTNNVDNCSRYCHAPATAGLFRTVGYGGDSGAVDDIDKAYLVIMKQVADMSADAKGACVLWAMGVTQPSNGSDTSTAISNLLLVSGNYMRPGTGAYPLRGHNNVQGASDHGSMPNFLPGYQPVDDPEVRRRFEDGWNVPLPSTTGLDNHEMVDAIHQGKLKAMSRFAEEMNLVDSNASYVSAAFS